MTTLKTVEDIVKEARNDFDLAKASAGREVSMSYWLTETLTQDHADIASALVEALEGLKGMSNFYNKDQTLTEAQNIIRTLLESKN